MELKAYEGTEKYIFVSYAHKDSEDVLRIISWLAGQGYRIWYDEGIAPGSEWPENIAQHLDRCAAVMAFVSPGSMASPNCRREITFGLSRQKPFLSVFLTQTEMPLGMELQLSSQQSVLRYNFKSEEAFLEKICACPDLEPCRKKLPETAPKTVPETVQEAPEVPPVLDMPKQEELREEKISPARPAAKERPKAKQVKQRPPREKKEPAASGKKLRTAMILGACAVLAVIATVVGILLYNTVTVVDGYQVKRSDTYVFVKDAVISSNVIERINKVKKTETLEFRGCTFEAGALDGLTVTPRNVTFTNCSGIDSFDVLAGNKALTTLSIENSDLKRLPDLSGTSLNKVDVSGNPGFSDITVLPMEALGNLDVSDTAVSDLGCLAGCGGLVSICADNTKVTDISCLAGLKKLGSLSVSNCPLKECGGEFASLELKRLNLADCGLKDCDAFRNTTILTKVDLSGNSLTDVSWLSKSAGTLTELNLSGNPLEPEQIGFISECAGLKKLWLNDISMKDLSLVESLSELETISAVHCGLENIDALEKLVNLTQIRLAYNVITDISPLRAIPFDGNSDSLDLAYNKITSTAVLDGLAIGKIALQGNPVAFTGDSFRGSQSFLLGIDYGEGLENSGLTDCQIANILITGCPADRQVVVKEAIGFSCRFVTGEELLEKLSPYFDYSPWADQ